MLLLSFVVVFIPVSESCGNTCVCPSGRPFSYRYVFFLLISLYSSSSNNNKTTSVTSATTTCSVYEGKVCLEAFTTTLPSLRLSPRFYGAEKNSVESYLAASITAINKTVTHSACKAALTAMLCHHTMPTCHANNTVIGFCMNDCKEFFFKCGHFVDKLEVATNLIPSGKDFRLSFPDCFGLKKSSELEEADEPCIKLGLSKYLRSVNMYLCLLYRHNRIMIYLYKPAVSDLHVTRYHQHDELTNLMTKKNLRKKPHGLL